MDPRAIRDLLARMQATQDRVRFPVAYPNPFPGGSVANAIDEAAVAKRAVELFCERRPDYNVRNLAVTLLVSRALDELRRADLSAPTVVLTNGCCTLPACPTTVFLGCVLDAVAHHPQ